MTKVLGAMSKFIFAAFGIAVLALLMSLTYGALQRLFPGNLANQMWGLVMFDIAAICWALAFVYQCKSVVQYAAAGIGFLVGFIGTLGMVAAEVMLSGQTLTPEQILQISKWMTYGFIIVTALHAALVYVHHGAAPQIHEQINIGIARGEITTEAIRQATNELEAEKARLAETIHQGIEDQVKRDLNIPILADPRMPIIPAEPVQYAPVIAPAAKQPSIFEQWKNKFFKQAPPPVTYEQTAPGVSNTNPKVSAADIELAKSINPLAAPYRACSKCGDTVPLTLSHCAACGTQMPALHKPQEEPPYHPVDLKPQPKQEEPPAASDASFPAGQ